MRVVIRVTLNMGCGATGADTTGAAFADGLARTAFGAGFAAVAGFGAITALATVTGFDFAIAFGLTTGVVGFVVTTGLDGATGLGGAAWGLVTVIGFVVVGAGFG